MLSVMTQKLSNIVCVDPTTVFLTFITTGYSSSLVPIQANDIANTEGMLVKLYGEIAVLKQEHAIEKERSKQLEKHFAPDNIISIQDAHVQSPCLPHTTHLNDVGTNLRSTVIEHNRLAVISNLHATMTNVSETMNQVVGHVVAQAQTINQIEYSIELIELNIETAHANLDDFRYRQAMENTHTTWCKWLGKLVKVALCITVVWLIVWL
jgi:hypothetical protein